MTNETTTIANGTPVICQTGGSHFLFGQVVFAGDDKWGTYYDICVTLISTEEEQVSKFETVHVISDETMKGIGWKLASTEDIRIANLYLS
jgi:hypothetical protein